MPQRATIERAMSVARRMSSSAPELTVPISAFSAARPARRVASWAFRKLVTSRRWWKFRIGGLRAGDTSGLNR
jgi:hypothetical protein